MCTTQPSMSSGVRAQGLVYWTAGRSERMARGAPQAGGRAEIPAVAPLSTLLAQALDGAQSAEETARDAQERLVALVGRR